MGDNNVDRINGKYMMLFMLISVLFVSLGFYYLHLSTRNVVIMDYWRIICQFIEPVMNGDFRVSDLWVSLGGQRCVIQNIILVINIRFFHLNCVWESYAGMLIIPFTCYVVWSAWLKETCSIENLKGSNKVDCIVLAATFLTLFNYNQWEILSLQFSLMFMIRILMYVFIMKSASRLLKVTPKVSDSVFLGIMVASAILFVSELKWPILVISLVILQFVDALIKKRLLIKQHLALWGLVIISILIYSYKLNTNSTGGNIAFFLKSLINGTFLKGALYMLVGVCIPQSRIETMSESSIIFVGIIIALIVLTALFLYFKERLHSISYFPLALCIYGLFAIPIILFGRLSINDFMYLTSSRYTCETTLLLLGTVLIYGLLLKKRKTKLMVVPIVVISLFMLFSVYAELSLAPFRGAYKDDCINILMNIDDYNDEDLSVFQANEPEMVRDGAVLLEEYNLNVYYDAES